MPPGRTLCAIEQRYVGVDGTRDNEVGVPGTWSTVKDVCFESCSGVWYGTPEPLYYRAEDMTPGAFLARNRDLILDIAARYGAGNVRVFGSTARGDARPDSDIDLLVDLEAGRSLLDHVGLWQDLEELLGRRVDVLVEGGISRHLRQRILAEAKPL